MIKDIAFIAYPSDDVARSRVWYEDSLGLRFAGPYVEDGVEKYNEAHFPTGCFGLIASEWAGRAPGTASGLAFEVDDIEASIRDLRAKGVTVDDVWDGPVCKQASLLDGDGNRLLLHETKPGRR